MNKLYFVSLVGILFISSQIIGMELDESISSNDIEKQAARQRKMSNLHRSQTSPATKKKNTIKKYRKSVTIACGELRRLEMGLGIMLVSRDSSINLVKHFSFKENSLLENSSSENTSTESINMEKIISKLGLTKEQLQLAMKQWMEEKKKPYTVKMINEMSKKDKTALQHGFIIKILKRQCKANDKIDASSEILSMKSNFDNTWNNILHKKNLSLEETIKIKELQLQERAENRADEELGLREKEVIVQGETLELGQEQLGFQERQSKRSNKREWIIGGCTTCGGYILGIVTLIIPFLLQTCEICES